MDWILSAFTILGNWLTGKKIPFGWIILAAGAFLWIYYALSLNPPQYGLIPASLINLALCGINAWKWSK